MKLLTIAIMTMAGLLNAVPSIACDDHVGKCELEDWRWSEPFGNTLELQGVSTCNKGLISIRIYEKEGEDETFLGTTTGVINGHVVTAVASDIEYFDFDAIVIRYAIQPM